MKRKISILVLCFILLFSPKAFAATGPEVEATVTGNIENGQTIQILINIKDIKSFFAGAMEFKYDKNVLKVKSIELGDLISKADINKFDAMNKIDDKNGIAAYGFSCLGKVNGFSGTGTFVKINAEVLKKDSFHVRSKAFLASPNDDFNLKLQICDSNIKELEYSFKPYEFSLNGTNGSNSSTNTGTSTNTSTSNAGGSTENSSASNNTSTAASASSSQNNASKTTTAEDKNDKTIVQKIITAVTNVFNGDKKDDSKKSETENKTVEASGNTETQDKSEDTNKNSQDKSKSNGANNTVSSNKVYSTSNKPAMVLLLVILMGAGLVLYALYRIRKSKKKV
ncbi:cohesin domain-containing protein [Clostridium omnivorum]|uniref:Cohesin domain-containing protein n=1 Tax=Clostridium omnivorum TaxID=1604902 RepID=A0ABQ5N3D1_9CLOT|nr:cohesin domain-containing protein [Clostridium sp. E14]GLC29701.1 hypothetical protein bsdE14_11110 [Clostridium sp. E14]